MKDDYNNQINLFINPLLGQMIHDMFTFSIDICGIHRRKHKIDIGDIIENTL